MKPALQSAISHFEPAGAVSAAPQSGSILARKLFGDPVPPASVADFFERLGGLLHYGKSIPESMLIAARPSDPELRAIIESVAGPVSNGIPLHEALKRYRKRLPEIVIPTLETAYVSGTLESASTHLSRGLSRMAETDRQFRFTALNPLTLFLVYGAYSALTLITGGLYSPVDTLITILLGMLKLAGLYLALRLGWNLIREIRPVRLAIDTVLLAIPDFGAALRNRAAARWARAFTILWNAGVPVSTALDVSSRSTLNAHYEQAIHSAAIRTRTGASLPDSLATTDMLPRHFIDILRAGHESGSFGTILERFADGLEQEAYTKSARQFMVGVTAFSILLTILAVTAALRF